MRERESKKRGEGFIRHRKSCIAKLEHKDLNIIFECKKIPSSTACRNSDRISAVMTHLFATLQSCLFFILFSVFIDISSFCLHARIFRIWLHGIPTMVCPFLLNEMCNIKQKGDTAKILNARTYGRASDFSVVGDAIICHFDSHVPYRTSWQNKIY